MNYDSFCMAAAVEELREGYIGSFVDRVSQPDELTVVLAFSGRGPRRHWLLSSDARWPRSHETQIRRANPASPPAFCMLLRKYLDGARLQEVAQPRFDRILQLQFRRGEESVRLVQEVMGRHSNLLLVGSDGAILGAVKTVSAAQTRVRPVYAGLPYQLPPGDRPDPRTLRRDEIAALLRSQPALQPEAITRTLSGWGTFPAREAFASVPTTTSSPDALAEAIFARMEQVRERRFRPTLFLDEREHPKGIWAFPSMQEGWRNGKPFPTVSTACDAYFSELERGFSAESLRKELGGALQRALRTAELQLAEAQGFLDGMAETDACRIRGELLMAHSSQVERGAEAVEVPNWYDPRGGTLRIELDPERSAKENAERFFRRYRRGMAGAEAALERIPELERRVAELGATQARILAAPAEELPGLREQLRSQGLFREISSAPTAAGAREPELPAGVRIKRAQVGGWEIQWGENATSNDYLTMRLARPHDLWLHARAITGTHVVIREVRSLDRLPPQVLREAARLAAAHSEAKHSSVVAVDYTFRRYVRKPRGSAPGAVVYSAERTLHVDPRTGE